MERLLVEIASGEEFSERFSTAKHLIVQLMHTNYIVLRLLKWLKL